MTELAAEQVSLFTGALLVHNVLLMQGLGLAPFVESAGSIRLRLAVGTTILVTTIVVWALYHHVLIPLAAGHLELPLYALVIVAVGGLAERVFPDAARRGAAALVAANSAALGAGLAAIAAHDQWSEMLALASGVALGVVVVSALLAAHAERLSDATIPVAFRGAPITLITVGIASLAFMGLAGVGG